MKKIKQNLEQIINFLRAKDYADAQASEEYGHDIYIPSIDVKLKIFEGWDDQTQSVFIYVGRNSNDGYEWDLLNANYAIIVTPKIYLIATTHSLLEFIINNQFHSENRYKKAKPGNIIAKLRLSWLTHALPIDQADGEVRMFDKETGEEIILNCYQFESPIPD